MSDSQSVDFGIDQSLHINPLSIAPAIKTKVNNKLFQSSNQNQSIVVKKCVNVLQSNKLTGKLAINPQYQQYLAEISSNPDAVIVTFLGARRVGKSFLVDSLLTYENNKICRVMCKSNEQIINSPTISTKNSGNQHKLIYFDCNAQTSNLVFLWCYFLSSIIVYNIGPNDKTQQQNLLNNLTFTQSHLDFQLDNFSLPQFVLVIRDSDNRSTYRDLVNNIQTFGLFQPQITVIHLPYPGSENVASKQIVDVPLKQINPKFQSEVEMMMKILRNGRAKIIKETYLSTKILSLSLEPLTKYINRQHKINTNKIWDEVIENLSIGFYNFYLKKYDQQLALEFQNQKPCDKYTLYKKLSNMKRKINKKIQSFVNLKDDPIFSKYKNKLNNVIKSKEKLIKQVNQSKSKQANQKYCQMLLAQINNNNCEELIDQYCKSDLDDQKSVVLLNNVQKVIQQKSKLIKKLPGKAQNLHKEIQKIQFQIQDLERKVKQRQKLLINAQSEDVMKKRLQQKKQKVKSLSNQQDLLQKNINSLMSEHKKNNQIVKLQQQRKKLSNKIDKDQKQIIQLRQNRERQTKQVSKSLESKLKKQQQNLSLLQKRLRQAKNKPVKPQQKKSTCCCILM